NGKASFVQGALAGAIGGVVAAWAMDRAQSAFSQAIGDNPSEARDEDTRSQGGQRSRAHVQRGERSEPATMVATTKAARALTGERPGRQARWWGGVGLHYAFGAGVGAVYGALAEAAPIITRGAGL